MEGEPAQETRLSIYRLLVEAGPDGVAAGRAAEKLKVPGATLSFHLKELARAGLVSSRQERQFVYCAADFEDMAELMTFLTQNCCKGMPEGREQWNTMRCRVLRLMKLSRPMPGMGFRQDGKAKRKETCLLRFYKDAVLNYKKHFVWGGARFKEAQTWIFDKDTDRLFAFALHASARICFRLRD
jgi:ArsR family transcriptional regulator